MSIQTSDADLKAAQSEISVDGNGVVAGFTGTANIGTNAGINPGGAGVMAGAGRVVGTIGSVNGCSPPAVPYASNSSLAVYGGKGGADSDGGYPGNNGGLTETSQLTSNGTIIGGQGGDSNTPFGLGGTGGTATVVLDGTKTSWANINMVMGGFGTNYGGGTTGNGGNVYLVLNSTQTSATLNITFGPSSYGQVGVGFDCYITITGSSLSDLSIATTGSSNLNNNSGGQWDISGTIASDASINALVLVLIAAGNPSGTLNAGGTCSPCSSGTLANIATLTDLGWTIINN